SPNKPADRRPTTYRFDPHNPAPSLGGNVSSQGFLMAQGAMDQRCRPDFWLCSDSKPLSTRSDVLVFQTPPRREAVAVTGRLIAKRGAASNAPDPDFPAKPIDV